MTFLLIDNSNTRTKFRLADPSGLGEWSATVLTCEITPALLAPLLNGLGFDQAVLCSVVPEKAAVLRAFLKTLAPVHEISFRSHLPISIDYPAPEQIGADRLANAVAVHARFGCPAIVIDFGTAVTFDVVGESDAYLGGVIAPGLAAMTENLSCRTALLPQIDLQEPETAIGKSTVHAMQVGAVLGYRGMIREILKGISLELPATPIVIATGGDAELISRGLPEIARVDPTLTLEGVRLIGLANISPDSDPGL